MFADIAQQRIPAPAAHRGMPEYEEAPGRLAKAPLGRRFRAGSGGRI